MGVGITEMIEKQIVHLVLTKESLDDSQFDKDFILKVLKKMVSSKLKGYTENMLRVRGEEAHKHYLQKFYPIEQFPEKHI